MGLDVTAYKTAILLPAHDFVDACYDDDHQRAYVIHPDFNRSLRGLEADRCYGVAQNVPLGWRAGSYGGYGMWRAALCKAALDLEYTTSYMQDYSLLPASHFWADPDSHVDDPFYELLNFADNEGTIGPEACADLLADFEANRDKFVAYVEALGDGTYFVQRYDDWTEGCRLATPRGMVVLH